MDTRKTTLIITISVIALLSIGIGFAYTAYTSNSGNTSDTAYVTLTQTGEGAYQFADGTNVQLDTFNKDQDDRFYYKLSDPILIDTDATDYYVGILGQITLQADFEGSATPVPSLLNVEIAASGGFDATTTWKYFLTAAPTDDVITTIYAQKTTTAEASSEWESVSDLQITRTNNAYNPVTVYVCYGYDKTAETEEVYPGIYFLPYGPNYEPKDLIDASIVFKANSNATVTYNANNGAQTVATFKVKAQLNENYTLLEDAPAGFVGPAQTPTFLGWGTAADSDSPITTPQLITEDVTYYAIWGPEQ